MDEINFELNSREPSASVTACNPRLARIGSARTGHAVAVSSVCEGNTSPMSAIVYKILTRSAWAEARAAGVFHGAPVDLADGFVHFSTASQVRETAAKHFAGLPDLLLVGFAAEAFGAALKWELSRGGALFPHLYAALDPELAIEVVDLPLGPDGRHRFPETIP